MRSPVSAPSWRPLDKIASTLADKVIDFNDPAVLLAAEQCSCKKLISLFNYAMKKNLTGMSISNLEIFASKCDEIDNTDTSIKEIGSVPGSVSTLLLNEMITIFWKLEEVEGSLYHTMSD